MEKDRPLAKHLFTLFSSLFHMEVSVLWLYLSKHILCKNWKKTQADIEWSPLSTSILHVLWWDIFLYACIASSLNTRQKTFSSFPFNHQHMLSTLYYFYLRRRLDAPFPFSCTYPSLYISPYPGRDKVILYFPAISFQRKEARKCRPLYPHLFHYAIKLCCVVLGQELEPRETFWDIG